MTKKLIALTLILALMIPSFVAFGEDEAEIDYKKIEDMIEIIEYNYKYDITKEELIYGAYSGIVNVLDKHSSYFSKDEYEEFLDSFDSSLIGIGVFIEEENGFIKIITPIDGSPAYHSGLKSGDLIIAVNGIDVTDLSYESAINMIRGEAGSQVRLTYVRNGVKNEIVITRQEIEIPNVRYNMLNNNIGYIRITQFGNDVYEEVDQALSVLDNADGLILDLRNNPGGYLSEVVRVAERFVDKNDVIVKVDYKNFKDELHISMDDSVSVPVIVLINSASASASEILAGAIKYNNKGLLIGETTYGKGSVQSLLLLKGRAAMKITTAEYLSAKDTLVNHVGIEPDILMPSLTEEEIDEIKYFAPMIGTEVSHYGLINLDIYGAQQRLDVLGYDVELTGKYDQKTSKAIDEFQLANNIEERHALYNSTKVKLDEMINLYLNEDPQLEKAIDLLMK